jgi:transcriptional regulator with XRE-family HTH domain
VSDLPQDWDSYDPNDHERSDQPGYRAERADAARRAERRRAAYGEALSTLRRARSLTQVAVAEQLGVAQGEVSRIEHQADLLLSTLTRYIDGMDGTLSLLVRFDDNETIELSLVLDDLAQTNPVSAVVPDPMTAIRLASFIGRYDSQEEKFHATAAA